MARISAVALEVGRTPPSITLPSIHILFMYTCIHTRLDVLRVEVHAALQDAPRVVRLESARDRVRARDRERV